MLIHKDQVTVAGTKTKLRAKKVVNWDATLTMWFVIVIAFAVARFVLLGR